MRKILPVLQVFLLITLLATALLWFAESDITRWRSFWAYRQLFFNGWLNTIFLSIASLGLSLLIGTVAALLQRSGNAVFAVIVKVYVELIRGTPLLVQILFFFYVVAHAIGLENRYIAGVVILSVFHGAYIAEMIRSGLDNISVTQCQSAKAIGLSTLQIYRFVVFPQAVRIVIPPLAGQFASIIKDSSLLSVIGINEVTNSAQQINSATYDTLESFLPLAAAYLVLTLPISLLSKRLEKRFQYET